MQGRGKGGPSRVVPQPLEHDFEPVIGAIDARDGSSRRGPQVTHSLAYLGTSMLSHECSGLVVHYTLGKVDTRKRAFSRMRAMKSMYSTYLSYSLASSGESVPSFAFSASSSRRAWSSGLGFGSSAKYLATS